MKKNLVITSKNEPAWRKIKYRSHCQIFVSERQILKNFDFSYENGSISVSFTPNDLNSFCTWEIRGSVRRWRTNFRSSLSFKALILGSNTKNPEFQLFQFSTHLTLLTYDSVINCVKDAQPRKETKTCQVITKISPSVKVNDMIWISSPQNDQDLSPWNSSQTRKQELLN